MLRSYLRLVLFTLGLLFGVQIPGFISDYSKRVEAHLIEAQQAVKGYTATAQQFFKGDIQALIQHYRDSEDPVFRTDADNIDTLMNRTHILERQWLGLQGAVVFQSPFRGHVRRPGHSSRNLQRLYGKCCWHLKSSPGHYHCAVAGAGDREFHVAARLGGQWWTAQAATGTDRH